VKIAFCIINHNKWEGTSKAIAEVAERLAMRHEVHIFSRSAIGVDLESIQWHSIHGPSCPHVAEFLGYVMPLDLLLRVHQFDIIHAAGALSPRADIYTIQNIQPAKTRILERLESPEAVNRVRRWTRRAYIRITSRWERACYRVSKRRRPMFLPVSSGVQRELQSHYGIESALCRIVPNAADTARFKPVSRERKTAIRETFGLQREDFVIAFSGGDWRRKGLDFAIRALGCISSMNVKLLILGKDHQPALFEHLASDCEVSGRVVFAGHQAAVEEGLACADIFLAPSHYEAFSLATIEAAACGLPIVATKINGTEDFIRPGETGEFIEHAPEQIAATLKPLITDRERCLTMGRCARSLVIEHYTWDRVASLTERCYQERLETK